MQAGSARLQGSLADRHPGCLSHAALIKRSDRLSFQASQTGWEQLQLTGRLG